MDRNTIRVKAERHSYTERFLYSSLKRVYVDETGFSLWTKRSYDRSRVDEKANRFVGRNVTVIAAIAGLAAILYYELHFGNVNVKSYQIFMVSFEEILDIAHLVVAIGNAPMY